MLGDEMNEMPKWYTKEKAQDEMRNFRLWMVEEEEEEAEEARNSH